MSNEPGEEYCINKSVDYFSTADPDSDHDGETSDIGVDAEYDASMVIKKYQKQIELTDTQLLLDNISLTKKLLELTEEKMELKIFIEQLKGNMKVMRSQIKNLKNKLK
jgi:hypothetical protein